MKKEFVKVTNAYQNTSLWLDVNSIYVVQGVAATGRANSHCLIHTMTDGVQNTYEVTNTEEEILQLMKPKSALDGAIVKIRACIPLNYINSMDRAERLAADIAYALGYGGDGYED